MKLYPFSNLIWKFVIDATCFTICTIGFLCNVHVYLMCIFTFGMPILACFTYKGHNPYIHVWNYILWLILLNSCRNNVQWSLQLKLDKVCFFKQPLIHAHMFSPDVVTWYASVLNLSWRPPAIWSHIMGLTLHCCLQNFWSAVFVDLGHVTAIEVYSKSMDNVCILI